MEAGSPHPYLLLPTDLSESVSLNLAPGWPGGLAFQTQGRVCLCLLISRIRCRWHHLDFIWVWRAKLSPHTFIPGSLLTEPLLQPSENLTSSNCFIRVWLMHLGVQVWVRVCMWKPEGTGPPLTFRWGPNKFPESTHLCHPMPGSEAQVAALGFSIWWLEAWIWCLMLAQQVLRSTESSPQLTKPYFYETAAYLYWTSLVTQTFFTVPFLNCKLLSKPSFPFSSPPLSHLA